MKLKIIYPAWPKLKNQPEFHLPPHGPVCFAAALPPDVEVSFCDEHVQELVDGEHADLVAISCMLTCQMPRGWQIADSYRRKGVPVIFGGIGTMLHPRETLRHADSIFLGEAEGRMEEVIGDARKGRLKPVYDYQTDLPDTSTIKPARRDILTRELYNFRGVQMVDLVHASRGCRFNCFPCCTPYLGGRCFRPRPVENVIEELAGIENNRLFFVDNSLAQDDEWEKELFKALIPMKKKWISHPIKDDDEILDLAAEAGCWYVYQAIVDTSEVIAERIRRLKERDIGVEGTVLLGLDKHDEDYIKRMVDFLLELELDLAEFTIMTPFPGTPLRTQLESEDRILHNDWARYTCGETVFEPANLTVDKLNELNQYAWETFYADCSIELRMAKLYVDVIRKEKADGTFKKITLDRKRKWGGSK